MGALLFLAPLVAAQMEPPAGFTRIGPATPMEVKSGVVDLDHIPVVELSGGFTLDGFGLFLFVDFRAQPGAGAFCVDSDDECPAAFEPQRLVSELVGSYSRFGDLVWNADEPGVRRVSVTLATPEATFVQKWEVTIPAFKVFTDICREDGQVTATFRVYAFGTLDGERLSVGLGGGMFTLPVAESYRGPVVSSGTAALSGPRWVYERYFAGESGTVSFSLGDFPPADGEIYFPFYEELPLCSSYGGKG